MKSLNPKNVEGLPSPPQGAPEDQTDPTPVQPTETPPLDLDYLLDRDDAMEPPPPVTTTPGDPQLDHNLISMNFGFPSD